MVMLSNNYLFNVNSPSPRVNAKNFAINGRCYDPKIRASYLDPQIAVQGSAYKWTSKSINGETALGLSHFHENRYVGRAIYSYSWEPYGHSKFMMSGLNTNGAQQMSVLLAADPREVYPNDQTMLMFSRANIVVLYGKDGVNVLGR
jgi:hypothetical protein